MRKIASLLLLAVAVTAAACTNSPTSSPGHGDYAARFDGGVFGGSGNAAGTTPPPPPDNATAAGTEVTAADSSNSRGGVFGGSGN
jgi:hypothetical protein